jgi:hypothetical protein
LGKLPTNRLSYGTASRTITTGLKDESKSGKYKAHCSVPYSGKVLWFFYYYLEALPVAQTTHRRMIGRLLKN